MLDPFRVRVEPRIGGERGKAEDPAEAAPEFVVPARHVHRAVGGLEGAEGGDRRVPVAERNRVLPRSDVTGDRVFEHGDHRVEHGDVDELTPFRAAARLERGEDADRAEHPGEDVRDRTPDLRRMLRVGARDAHHAAHALDDQIVGGSVAVGSGLAEARRGAVDEFRVQGREVGVAQAEARHHAGLEVLDEHVGFLRQTPQDLLPAGILQVERDALLPAVDAHEIGAFRTDKRAEGPGVVALPRPLNLDHLGAEIGEHHRAERAGEDAGEVEDAEAVEGSRHGITVSTRFARRGAWPP